MVVGKDPIGRYLQEVLSRPAHDDRHALAKLYADGQMRAGDVRRHLAQFQLTAPRDLLTEQAHTAALRIRQMATAVGAPVSQFYPLLMRYYQCDIGGHSLDAGGHVSLDFVLDLDLPFADESIWEIRIGSISVGDRLPSSACEVTSRSLRWCAY